MLNFMFPLFLSDIELIEFSISFNIGFTSLSLSAGYDLRIGVSLIFSLVAKNIGRLSFSASTFNAKHISFTSDRDFDAPCLFFTVPGILSPHIPHSVSFASVISSFKNLALPSSFHIFSGVLYLSMFAQIKKHFQVDCYHLGLWCSG